MVTLPTLVVFPVLLLTTVFVMQAAIWMYHRQEAQAAAQRGAVAAAVASAGARRLSPNAAASTVQAEAVAAAKDWFGDHPPADLKVTPRIEGVDDDVVVIEVSYTVPSVFRRLRVSASAARPVEVFRPAPPGLGQ